MLCSYQVTHSVRTRGQGCIVNIAWRAGTATAPFAAAYSTGKGLQLSEYIYLRLCSLVSTVMEMVDSALLEYTLPPESKIRVTPPVIMKQKSTEGVACMGLLFPAGISHSKTKMPPLFARFPCSSLSLYAIPVTGTEGALKTRRIEAPPASDSTGTSISGPKTPFHSPHSPCLLPSFPGQQKPFERLFAEVFFPVM